MSDLMKVAAEYDAAGRIMARGFVEEFNKLALALRGQEATLGKAVGGGVPDPKSQKMAPMKEVQLGGARPQATLGSVTGDIRASKMPKLPGRKTPSSEVTIGKVTRLPGSGMRASSKKMLSGR